MSSFFIIRLDSNCMAYKIKILYQLCKTPICLSTALVGDASACRHLYDNAIPCISYTEVASCPIFFK
jgi:hypothetical protein